MPRLCDLFYNLQMNEIEVDEEFLSLNLRLRPTFLSMIMINDYDFLLHGPRVSVENTVYKSPRLRII
jgi:hypothetical protein